ncbi:MAG: S41 family peptidase [Christensenellales bacterium]|nr:carboxyl-terminal protease [Clostridium sp. CAG:465]
MNDEYKNERKRFINKAVIISIIVIFSAIVIGAMTLVAVSLIKNTKTSNGEDISKYMTRIEDAIKMVKSKYIDDIDTEKLVDGAVAGIAEATGDPYTRYMDEEEYSQMLNSGTETYGGLGIHITYDTKSEGIIILGIMPDAPALDADLKIGDVILSVDGTVVSQKSFYECVDKLKGEAGSEVKLIIKRDNDTLEKTVKREEIIPNNVESDIMDGNIGYIRIWSFDNNVYKQFKTEYEKLKSKNITGLVIDVRNNPGGLVSDTVSILKEMLPKCDIVKLVYKDESERVYKCDGKNQINIPVAVLVNSGSASASEILASAIKDSNTGVLIGTKTYGKGIVQEVQQLDGKGALSITVAKYYTASGVEIHKNGIEPNITVELPEEYQKSSSVPRDKDTQLIKAIEYINSKK